VRPKIVSSVHYCPATKKTMERKYTDMTSLDPYPSSAVYPTKDEDGNLLETEFGLCTFKDHQTFSIQVRESLLCPLSSFYDTPVFLLYDNPVFHL